MKTRIREPIIYKIVHEDGRVQWGIRWNGIEYAKFNTYELAEKQANDLKRTANNAL